MRELVEGNYRIIYKLVDKGRIDILTIHHRSGTVFGLEVKWFVGATCIRPFLTTHHFFIPNSHCQKISI